MGDYGIYGRWILTDIVTHSVMTEGQIELYVVKL